VSEHKCGADRAPPCGVAGESAHFEYKRQDRILDIQLDPLRAPSGETIECIGVGLDITVRQESEELVRYQATHDALTGLANYREFMDTLERELRRAERGHHSFTAAGKGYKRAMPRDGLSGAIWRG
jgi:hypothetical protein